MVKVQYLHSIDAKLATNIGEDSVSNPIQAIIELVKNSYDADANRVTVTFQGTETQDADVREIHKIIINDDGIGMTHEDIRDKFFRIGTGNKLQKTESSKYKRRVVGEKGQGHYAAKRLGEVCKIISNPENYDGREYSESMDKTITVTLDWREFKDGMNFGEIISYGEILERKIEETHGVSIELSELRETKWTVDQIKQVIKELGMLMTPPILLIKKKESDAEKFEIYVEAPGFETQETKVDSSALNMALLKLTATAEYNEKQDKTIIKYNIYKRKKSDKGYIWDKQFHHKKLDNKTIKEGNLFGNANFTLYHFPQSSKWGEEQKKIISRKNIQDFTKAHSGIKIFNDGVRMMPFGERSHPTLYDWAGIDARTLRSQMGGKIRQDTIVGFLHLTRESTVNIREVATRQGIKESLSFKNLREVFIREMYEELEEFRGTEKPKEKTKVYHEEKAQSYIKQMKAHIEKISMDSNDKSFIFNVLNTLSKEIVQASEDNKIETDELTGSLDMYRPLSTLGISTLAFDHEIGPKFTIVNTYLKNLLDEEGLSNNSRDDIFTAIEKMKEVQSWREFLDIFADALGDTAKARKARDPINLRDMLNNLKKSLEPVLLVKTKKHENIPIQVDISIIGDADLLYANKASFLSIFTNLILNSIKALRFVEREKPVIKINIWHEQKQLLISFTDNGNGIPDENDKKIWKPFFSSYPKTGIKSELKGMGLGLTITKEIIDEQYYGNIELDKTQYDKDKPGKGFTTFLISMPLKELSEKR